MLTLLKKDKRIDLNQNMKNYLEKIGITLNREDFTDNETITAVIQTTRGNFRLLNRLFRQVVRIMKINEVKILTKEIIFAARV